MRKLEENEFLYNIIKEFKQEIPAKLLDLSIYNEIESFKDAEYIYCIAYEMLIRTDEYNKLLKEYKPLRNISKHDMSNKEFSKLRELIDRMNDLGLKKTSFLGFDCDDDSDHVFKRIEHYDEVQNSPWSVKMLHKFKLDSNEDIFYLLAKFYFEKNKLYKRIDDNLYLLKEDIRVLTIDYIKSKSEWKTEAECNDFYELLKDYYIPCIEELTDPISYKSLSSNSIYLSELDKDFLSLLEEKKTNDLLIPIKSNFTHNNIEFWNKYYVNDIKDGLNKLIDFHKENNFIYDKNSKHSNVSKNEILKNLSNFYIPCVNRLMEPELFKWDKQTDPVLDDDFLNKIEFDGANSLVGDKGYITLKKEENIYLVQLSEYILLSLLDDSFLETLSYENLKNKYIDTEPLFSRPRLMFDEARLTNIPINLNLSKEDLLLYISQIKDDYDRDKNIVKTDIEYFFDLTLESDFVQLPTNIKFAYEKRTSKDKKFLPIKRHEFTKKFASAFYIYDLYKFLIPLFIIKRKDIRRKRRLKIKEIKEYAKKLDIEIDKTKIIDIKERSKREIKNYENNNLITEISYLTDNLSEEQVKYYLVTMKDFIHGVNKKGEYCPMKRKYKREKTESKETKYKNLIIGNSYIIKNNKADLIKNLIG